MNVVICSLAIGGRYPDLIARLIQRFREHSPNRDLLAWVNVYPACAPGPVVIDGYDYGPYCAKPWMLLEAEKRGADIVIMLDASFYPIRDIQPLVDHIHRYGIYLCRNGFKVGQWCSDGALQKLGFTRQVAWQIEEISSYCVGFDLRNARAREVIHWWQQYSLDRVTFCAPHTNSRCPNPIGNRNIGFVSDDQTVMGHRHDQTALSLLVARIYGPEAVLVERPRLTAYRGHSTEATVLECWGDLP